MAATRCRPFPEITAKYPSFANAICAYASGSVIQGWGHANSDLDLFMVTDEKFLVDDSLEFFERHVTTADPVMHIVLGEFGAYRADIEVWRACQIDEIIGRFAAGLPSQDAPEVEKAEQDMLYRLASARPLHGAAWWSARREALLDSRYGLWLAENRKLIAETFLEDVGGLLISGDNLTATFAAFQAFLGALEALLALYGDYTVNRKWLHRRLETYQPKEVSLPEARAALLMAGAAEDPGGWAERTARSAQRMLLAVEGLAL